MKVLITSDWHMGVYNDPGDMLKLDNDAVLSLLAEWEQEYDLIVLNGDILESLKSEEVFFSHHDRTQDVLKSREPVVRRFLENKQYVWLVGNHDYPLETILGLPLRVELSLADGYTLIVEHGHLLRASKEFYTQFERRYYIMYWLLWRIDRWKSARDPKYSIEYVIEEWLDEYRHQGAQSSLPYPKKVLLQLAFRMIDGKADQPSGDFIDFLWQHAQQSFRPEKTLVSYGHTHCPQIKYADNQNVYINTGRFSHHTGYRATVFDTSTGKAGVRTSMSRSSRVVGAAVDPVDWSPDRMC